MTNTSPIQTKRLTLILILGSLAALGPLSIDMYLPAFPDMSRSFGASASSIQLSLTACMLGMALGQIIVGPLSDVRGRKRPLLLALSAYLLASLACAFAPTIEVLIALRFVQGAAGASGIVISRAIVRDLFEGPELTKFFAALSLVNGTAPILAPIIGGQILRFGDWRIVFYLLAVLSTLMLIAVAFRLPETLPVHHRVEGNLKTTFQTFGRLLSDRTFIGYAFAQAFAMGAMFAYISGSPFVLQNIYGASPQQFSFLFGLNGIGIILAAQTAGRLAGRVDSEKMMRIALTVVAYGRNLSVSCPDVIRFLDSRHDSAVLRRLECRDDFDARFYLGNAELWFDSRKCVRVARFVTDACRLTRLTACRRDGGRVGVTDGLDHHDARLLGTAHLYITDCAQKTGIKKAVQQKGCFKKITRSFTPFPQARHKPVFLPHSGREPGLVCL